MNQSPQATLPGEAGGEMSGLAPIPPMAEGAIDSAKLMLGRRELIIRHGADTYRLRITASNKLILTK